MKMKTVVLTITLLLASFPLFAAYDAFLKIDTIPGQSTSPAHQGWIDIESFSWGTGAGATASPAATRKCSTHEIIVVKRLDKASPKLAQAAMTGMLLPAVQIEVNGERHMLQNAIIKSVQNGNGPTGPTQVVTLDFARCMTHETGAGPNAMHKIDVKLSPAAIKMDTNATLALGRGLGEAVALQDLHFVGPNQAVLTVRGTGGTNQILIGLLRAAQTHQKVPELTVQARKAGGGQQEYLTIKLTDVLVSSYNAGGGGGAGFDAVTLNFAHLDGPMAPFHDVYIK